MSAPTPAPAAIEVRGLTKRFGSVTAVDGVAFEVREGEFFGFLGPNGAGKTTTINLLIGLARPDSGSIRVGGRDCSRNPKAAQHLIGVVPDESNLYPELTGFDNLCFCGALYGMGKSERRARAEALLDDFGLAPAARRRFGGYSKGMKRRLAIAAGIVHRPRVLFLDEPTTGIDVGSARQIRQLLAEMHRGGTTIFLTTHYIEEAERLCGRIAFIVEGRIVRLDAVDNLLKPVKDRFAAVISGSGPLPLEALAKRFEGFEFTRHAPDGVRVEASRPIPVGPIVRFLEEEGVAVAEARRMRLTLEDVFVRVTGIEAEKLKNDKPKAGS
jgi:ABC-2 type transport system ATP-binding protein